MTALLLLSVALGTPGATSHWKLTSRLEELQAEVAQLKEENTGLKSENSALKDANSKLMEAALKQQQQGLKTSRPASSFVEESGQQQGKKRERKNVDLFGQCLQKCAEEAKEKAKDVMRQCLQACREEDEEEGGLKKHASSLMEEQQQQQQQKQETKHEEKEEQQEHLGLLEQLKLGWSRRRPASIGIQKLDTPPSITFDLGQKGAPAGGVESLVEQGGAPGREWTPFSLSTQEKPLSTEQLAKRVDSLAEQQAAMVALAERQPGGIGTDRIDHGDMADFVKKNEVAQAQANAMRHAKPPEITKINAPLLPYMPPLGDDLGALPYRRSAAGWVPLALAIVLSTENTRV